MINPLSADEYTYENKTARIIMEKIISKIPLRRGTYITEEMAIQIYNSIVNNHPKRLEINGQVFVPIYNISVK